MRLFMFLLVFILVACSEVSAPPQISPSPSPAALSIGDALASAGSSPGADITTVGYVVVDGMGSRLVDGLSFSMGTTPQPLSATTAQIWLGEDAASALGNALHSLGDIRYATVLARGRVEGPGVYGAGGAYHYQMSKPQLQPLVPQDTTVAALLDTSATYEGQLVRVSGSLLTRADSALLVDHLGAGGLPAAKARQIKLRGSLRDTALLNRLQRAPTGSVRFGSVQVEGYWQRGSLIPLGLFPVS